MADQPTVIEIEAASAEKIAWDLLQEIKYIERQDVMPDRKWLLDTFAECIEAVRGGRAFVRREQAA